MARLTDPGPRIRAELCETLLDLNRAGLLSAEGREALERMQGEGELPAVRDLREASGLDREAFGELIGLSASQIARFERGEAVPKGPAAKLIDLIRRKGVDAVR